MFNSNLWKRFQSFLSYLQRLLTTHWRSLLLLLVGIYLPLQVFGELAEDIWENEGGFPWDVPLLLLIHSTASPQLDTFASTLTRFGVFWGVVPASILLLLVLLLRRRWRSLVYALTTLLGSAIINRTAKLLLHRVRPHLWKSPSPELDYGFPSGHAMSSMTFVAVLVILTWNTPWRLPVLILGSIFVFAIGWTRLYLGVHYPSDIVAGWMASIAWTVGVSLLIKPNLTQNSAK
ncbi:MULTISPECIES: phosphatase PAP2 family protein [unclassified Coleofasciculus]|uniref:phosphatase PAP2 family protein n=2 Tax=unclassified Coleofasciculus TaxID=2692782 RepID=UPI00187FC4D9|nr:phosphatase PAP2 family protein [Coleofasciculus sp. LEGE 07081]MBE9152402.1 phosphatase PAP2 family protein [Coleofasciculus sp. LEGE 07092]